MSATAEDFEEKLARKKKEKKLKNQLQKRDNRAHIKNATNNLLETCFEENKLTEGFQDYKATKMKNQAEFLERARKAHSSSTQSNSYLSASKDKHNVPKKTHSEKFEYDEYEFQKRMLRRSLRKQLGRNLCEKMVTVSIEDEQSVGIVTSTRSLIEKTSKENSCLVRSCSSNNMCSKSWECPTCNYMNEPVGLGEDAVCRICREPNLQAAFQEQDPPTPNMPFAMDDSTLIPMQNLSRRKLHMPMAPRDDVTLS